MTDVSLIGLGPMGIALARALRPKFTLTLWNRTAERAKPLLNQGTLLAPDARAAVEASPVVLVCVADYAASRAILAQPGVSEALRGKVLVQLSTGTPQDAREAWAAADGHAYLDGALLATPGQIGRPDTPLFISARNARSPPAGPCSRRSRATSSTWAKPSAMPPPGTSPRSPACSAR